MGAQGEQPPFKISFGEPRIVTAEERAHLEGQGHVVQPMPQKKEFIESGGRPVVANKWTQTSAKKLLNERDPIGAPRQEWAVVSVVIPGDTTTEQAKADKLCIKVAGCFETGEAATRFMQDLYAKRPYLDLHCIQTGYLVPFPVDDETRRHIKHYSEDPVAQEVMDSATIQQRVCRAGAPAGPHGRRQGERRPGPARCRPHGHAGPGPRRDHL